MNKYTQIKKIPDMKPKEIYDERNYTEINLVLPHNKKKTKKFTKKALISAINDNLRHFRNVKSTRYKIHPKTIIWTKTKINSEAIKDSIVFHENKIMKQKPISRKSFRKTLALRLTT